MSQDTINLKQDAQYDLVINKNMDLDAVITCQYYTGTTAADIVDFDFTAYSGATLTVKQKSKSSTNILEFSTLDGSLVLGTSGGTFQMVKTATELATIQTGEFEYFMYLSSATQSHRAFLSGKFIIEAVIL